MRVYFNTDPVDLLAELRYQAIAQKQSPQLIDCLDRAEEELATLRAENAEQYESKAEAENSREDLYAELSDLVKALEDAADRDPRFSWDNNKNLKHAYDRAVAALQRHSEQ